MQKQSLQTCSCGQALDLPEGEVKTICSCGLVWEIDNGGFWFTNLIIRFDPPSPKPKVSKVVNRAERYRNYPKSKQKRRKAGRKC